MLRVQRAVCVCVYQRMRSLARCGCGKWFGMPFLIQTHTHTRIPSDACNVFLLKCVGCVGIPCKVYMQQAAVYAIVVVFHRTGQWAHIQVHFFSTVIVLFLTHVYYLQRVNIKGTVSEIVLCIFFLMCT